MLAELSSSVAGSSGSGVVVDGSMVAHEIVEGVDGSRVAHEIVEGDDGLSSISSALWCVEVEGCASRPSKKLIPASSISVSTGNKVECKSILGILESSGFVQKD